MTWSRCSYVHPVLADYGKAFNRLWALTLIAIGALNGAVLAGPYFGILRGLAMVPAIWLVGPLGWPLLRGHLRRHRRRFGWPELSARAENWRLPSTVLVIHLAIMAGVMVVSGEGSAAWFEFVPMILVAMLVGIGWVLWVFYALEQERQHETLSPGGLPGHTVRLLRSIEDRCGPFESTTVSVATRVRTHPTGRVGSGFTDEWFDPGLIGAKPEDRGDQAPVA